MKKFLLLVVIFTTISLTAQMSEGFDDITTLTDWTILNMSNPVGTIDYFQGIDSVFPAYDGAPTAYLGANYNSTAGAGTISDWIMTPVTSLKNGDVISFYTRTGAGSTYPDRLELRISDAGVSSIDPTDENDTGSYSILAIEVNPTLAAGGYPEDWTEFTYTVVGMPAETDSKIAFRYFVTNGGPDGSNSNYIGIDAFSVVKNVAAVGDNVLSSSVSIFPNVATDNFTIKNTSNIALTSVSLFDINGRVVSTTNLNNLIGEKSINVSNLSAGMYFVEINSADAKITRKLIKK